MVQSTLNRPDTDNDVAARHEKELTDIERFQRELDAQPTADSSAENENIERARLKNQEEAAAKEPDTKGPATAEDAANKEGSPGWKTSFGDAQKAAGTDRRLNFLQRNRKSLIRIGGAGGITGLLVSGFLAITPFKMPAIMDTIVDAAGQRVERVVEHRAERMVIRYILQGSNAAVRNGNIIATGNPIGDLFANMRTSKFEDNLLRNHGLRFETGPNKTVRLIRSGEILGDAALPADIEKILENNKSLTKADLKRIVRLEISAFRFFKRAKFVNFLQLRYNVKTWGTREEKEEATQEQNREAAQEDKIKRGLEGMQGNLEELGDCLVSAGDDCKGTPLKGMDKNGGTQALSSAIDDSLTSDSLSSLAKATVAGSVTGGVSAKVSELVVGKLITKLGASAIPYVGQIDLAVRIEHFIYEAMNSDLLQKMHAKFMRRAYVVFFATFAGYADQIKAGGMTADIAGMIGEQFNGMEESASYNKIATGTAAGVGLTGIQKISDTVPLPEWAEGAKKLYNIQQYGGHQVMNLWYITITQALDALGDFVGDIGQWVVSHIPGADALLEQFAAMLSEIIEGLLILVGIGVDMNDAGAKAHLNATVGAVGAFNDHAKELGMRALTHSQALDIDTAIGYETRTELANMSLADRLFNLNNTHSLATQLAARAPTPNLDAPLGSMAMQVGTMVGSLPKNFAKSMTPKLRAADGTILEDIGASDAYGGLDSDIDVEPASELFSNTPCPEVSGDGSKFNTCTVDKAVVDSMNCVFVYCADFNDTKGVPSTPAPSTGTFTWPIQPTSVSQITSCMNATDQSYRVHQGIDIGAPLGSNIVAVADGTVIFSRTDVEGFIYYIAIKHSDGTITAYGHNQENLVAEGAQVKAGQVIGRVGSRGDSSGPHLHMNYIKNIPSDTQNVFANGSWSNVYNPLFNGLMPKPDNVSDPHNCNTPPRLKVR